MDEDRLSPLLPPPASNATPGGETWRNMETFAQKKVEVRICTGSPPAQLGRGGGGLEVNTSVPADAARPSALPPSSAQPEVS